jgi:hypothetical protein
MTVIRIVDYRNECRPAAQVTSDHSEHSAMHPRADQLAQVWHFSAPQHCLVLEKLPAQARASDGVQKLGANPIAGVM